VYVIKLGLKGKLGLEGNIPSLFYGVGTYCYTYGGSKSRNCSALLLVAKLEILDPS
jgi:hypothetical protein